MTFREFKLALRHIADLLGVDVDEVTTTIIASQGPLANNITLPKYTRYHDSPEAWTGAQRCITDEQGKRHLVFASDATQHARICELHATMAAAVSSHCLPGVQEHRSEP